MTSPLFTFVKDEFPVPCSHPQCALLHQRFFTASMDNTPYYEDVELPSGEFKRIRCVGSHEIVRTQWLVLLDGERYGEAYDTRKEAKAEAERLNAREEVHA